MAVTLPNAPPDTTAGIDRRGISTLAAGHMVVDAKPAVSMALVSISRASSLESKAGQKPPSSATPWAFPALRIRLPAAR